MFRHAAELRNNSRCLAEFFEFEARCTINPVTQLLVNPQTWWSWRVWSLSLWHFSFQSSGSSSFPLLDWQILYLDDVIATAGSRLHSGHQEDSLQSNCKHYTHCNINWWAGLSFCWLENLRLPFSHLCFSSCEIWYSSAFRATTSRSCQTACTFRCISTLKGRGVVSAISRGDELFFSPAAIHIHLYHLHVHHVHLHQDLCFLWIFVSCHDRTVLYSNLASRWLGWPHQNSDCLQKDVEWCRMYTSIPSLKLTARTWKWMLGILISLWDGLFSGAMMVSGSVNCIL